MAVAEHAVAESADSRSAAALNITRPQRHYRKVLAECYGGEKELCQSKINKSLDADLGQI